MTIQLPDLTALPSPLGKAEILLESAAEVEHALMVQYLYAAYSLKSGDEVTDPAQQAALDETSPDSWPQVLLGIAREEMGHLMTVQNLLLLGLAPNLEREDFPPQKDLYPFALHLEPLSQRSLAKYVVAEAPGDAEAGRRSRSSCSSSGSQRGSRSSAALGVETQ
ncbi:MAG: ferritin-like domain-containing protein, partial [Nocardioidaceae bacterium]